jgi:hypothetical protein
LCENLAFISVWNPTFLTLLLEHLLQNKEQVLKAVRELCQASQTGRAKEIENMLSNTSKNDVFQDIWPNLTIISCWTDGACQFYVDQLCNYVPNVKIQGKGLIATEAFISLPFSESHDPVLAVNSHFFEFIDESNGQIHLAHELSIGKTYSVVVSTGGGLYRYQLEDIIEVTGVLESAPTFRFVSKSNHISDLTGEKLNEIHAKKCLEKLFSDTDIHPEFYLLAPIVSNNKISYCLFLECDRLNDVMLQSMIAQLERMLRNNFHYDYCRRLGQLQDLRLFMIKCHGKDVYLKQKMNDGIKAGDVKAQCLSKNLAWDNYFEGTLFGQNRVVS